MQNIINYMKGNVRVEVEGAYPERFMNMCAENGIPFWNLERISEVAVRVTMTIGSYKRMRPLVDEAMCAVKPVRKTGAPFFLWRVRKRYALLAGMFLTLIVMWVMSLYIWDIEIEGNETVSTAAILQTLEEVGVSVGSFGPTVDQEMLRNEMLLKIDDLLWMTVNVSGSRARVIIRERIPAPEILDEDTPTSVYSTKTGIIVKMTVLDGVSLMEVGDTVMQGEDIVSGVMESISSGTRFVSARASVTARTWYEIVMQMPLEIAEKSYTGENKTKSTIIIAGNRINLYLSSGISYSSYDKITEESNLTLPGGIELPITTRTDTYSEYETVYSWLDESEAEEILKARLLERLGELMTDDGELADSEFVTRVEGGVITVTLKAECIEEIGAIRRLREDEFIIFEGTEEEGGTAQE